MGKNSLHKDVGSQLAQGLQQLTQGFSPFFSPSLSQGLRSRTAPACKESIWVSASSGESAEMVVAFPSRNVSTRESLLNCNCWAPCAPLY